MGLKFSSIYFFSASLSHAFFFGVFNALPVTLRSRLERNSIPKENCHSPTSRVSVFPYNLISREGYFSVSYFRTQPSFGNCEDIQIIVFEEKSNGIHLVNETIQQIRFGCAFAWYCRHGKLLGSIQKIAPFISRNSRMVQS